MTSAKVALIALAISASAQPARAQFDFPREGIAGVPNGVSEPFVGRWSQGISAIGLIAGDTITLSCDDPIVISAVDDVTITHAWPGAEAFQLELMSFANRTTWFPEVGASQIAVWVSADSFYLYPTDDRGMARWDDPHVYRRCPAGDHDS